MSVDCMSKYQKLNATFANGDEAYADKNSLYGPTLTDAVESCYTTMLANGVLFQPITKVWDQDTHTLTINKLSTSIDDYLNAVTFDQEAAITASNAAGWTHIGTTNT